MPLTTAETRNLGVHEREQTWLDPHAGNLCPPSNRTPSCTHSTCHATHQFTRQPRDWRDWSAASRLGGACPADWEIGHAELYAIFRYLQKVVNNADEPEAERVLILSDSQNSLDKIEEAWREGSARKCRWQDGGGLVEAICTLRMRLDRVVFAYCPAHRGEARSGRVPPPGSISRGGVIPYAHAVCAWKWTPRAEPRGKFWPLESISKQGLRPGPPSLDPSPDAPPRRQGAPVPTQRGRHSSIPCHQIHDFRTAILGGIATGI